MPPRDADAVPPNTCSKCVYPGPHPTPGHCIDTLRDRIAELQFRKSAPSKPIGRIRKLEPRLPVNPAS
jgi:hypothetical protein